MLQCERECWAGGVVRLAGVDEAGRGPLAGPVIAAAVVIERSFLEREEHGLLNGLTDSKQLTEARREHFCRLIEDCGAAAVGLGAADHAEIDAVNILRATHLAMARAVRNLAPPPDFAIVDGLPVPGLPCPSRSVVGGDARSLLIAAASVVAKVTRDRRMRDYDAMYPPYGFARHKGYGSAEHMQALLEYGPCPIHRRSFRPVREAADIASRKGGGAPP